MAAEGVEIVRVELQPASGNHERSGHPTGFQPQYACAGVDGFFYLGSGPHCYLISRLLVLQRNAEGIERVVVGGEEYMTVANRHASQVGIGPDCVAARVEFLAGSGIERVQSGMGRATAALQSKDYPVGDRRRRRILKIARA